MITAVTACAIAFLTTLAATPLARFLALRVGAIDVPDERRVHARTIPRGGGVAVIAGAATALATSGGAHASNPWLLAGLAVVTGLGLADDLLSLRPLTKLLGQAAAAICATLGGLHLGLFGAAPGEALALLDAALTVLWIVGITNALNLSDGLDGLAAGLGVIALTCLALAAIHAGHGAPAIHAIILTSALLGFLPYNTNPATIFLGDSGSLVIGYSVAVLPLSGPGGAGLPPPALFLLIAVPATDTLLAIARRFSSRCLPAWGEGRFWAGLGEGLRNTMSADRRHIHHRLLDLGFSQRQAVLVLYVAAAATGALAQVPVDSPGRPLDLLALALGLGVIALVRALGIDELRLARSGLLLPVLRRLGRHRPIVVAADVCVVSIAYGGALWLTGHTAGASAALGGLAVMTLAQLATFAALGVYRTAWEETGVGGLAVLVNAAAAGTIGGYAALRLLGLPTAMPVAVAYAALLLPILTLMRFAYPLLEQAVRRVVSAERTLICGTAAAGRHALGSLRRDGLGELEPIGFVELSPHRQGTQVGRLPVLGPLEALGDIMERERVRHLVIAETELRGRSLDWVRAVCRQRGVQVHHYVERLVPDDGGRRRISSQAATRALETAHAVGGETEPGGWQSPVVARGGRTPEVSG